jgi:hypothetical protein
VGSKQEKGKGWGWEGIFQRGRGGPFMEEGKGLPGRKGKDLPGRMGSLKKSGWVEGVTGKGEDHQECLS